jgi:hypothetical protein
VYWDFRHDAPQTGARSSVEAGASFWRRMRSGLTALPGVYTVKIKYEDQEVSQSFKLMTDPRMQIDIAVLEENFKLAKEIEGMSTALSKMEQEISDTRELIKMIRQYAMKTKSEKTMPLMKAGRDLDKKLAELAEKITPDTSKIQGISDRSAGLSIQVRMLNRAFGDSFTPPTQAATYKYEKMKTEVNAFIQEFNTFYEKDVENFKKAVEESGFSIFKPFKPIDIEKK